MKTETVAMIGQGVFLEKIPIIVNKFYGKLLPKKGVKMGDKREFTGLYTKYGKRIWTGDILLSEFNYFVHVVKDKEGDGFHGKLICDPENSCANIPYSLNNGKGHTHATVAQILELYNKYGKDAVNKWNH